MTQATHRVAVDAAPELVWELLVDRVEEPERFMEGVEAIAILDRSDNAVLREMTVNGATVREWIRIDESGWEITFTLVDDPLYEGTTVHRVEVDYPATTAMLIFSMDWAPLAPDTPDDPTLAERTVRAAALYAKALAEQRAKQKG